MGVKDIVKSVFYEPIEYTKEQYFPLNSILLTLVTASLAARKRAPELFHEMDPKYFFSEFTVIDLSLPRRTGKTTTLLNFINKSEQKCLLICFNTRAVTNIMPKITNLNCLVKVYNTLKTLPGEDIPLEFYENIYIDEVNIDIPSWESRLNFPLSPTQTVISLRTNI